MAKTAAEHLESQRVTGALKDGGVCGELCTPPPSPPAFLRVSLSLPSHCPPHQSKA